MLRKLRDSISKTFRYSRAGEYPRRYAVMNAFDGVVTVLGIVLGAELLGAASAGHIIAAGIGASIAMGVSGASGTYITETAEQERRVRELEEAMLRKLEGSVIVKAHKEAAIISAIVDSAAALLAGLLALSPYFMVVAGLIIEAQAFIFSILVSFSMLFILGAFLGRVAKRSILFSGLKALAAGILTLILLLIINLIL